VAARESLDMEREREIARRRACEGRVEASAQGVGQEGDVA
jgi:hypothetical protein